MSVVSYSRTYLWANLDKTLQGDTGAPSDEHGGPYGEPSIWAPRGGNYILKRLYFVFYVIITIISMAAFFHIDTSITPTTVLSVHQLILTVWPWWESLLTTTVSGPGKLWWILIHSALFSVSRQPNWLSASSSTISVKIKHLLPCTVAKVPKLSCHHCSQ